MIDGGKVKAELRDVGDSGARALQRIEEAARPASRALRALDSVSAEVFGGLEAMSGRLGALGSGLARLGPIGLAAGAALAGLGIVVSRSIEEAAKADQSYRRLEAVRKATGQASGLTADEIASFADGIERSTLATAEGVEDAASILATFRSFFASDLQGGALSFSWTHPGTGAVGAFRIVPPPAIEPVAAGIAWRVSVDLELLP